MSDRKLTLSDLLPGRQKADPKEMELSGLGNMTPSLLAFIGGKVEDAVEAALGADVLGLIAQAWTKVDALRDAAETSCQKKAPQYILLGEHELESEAKLKVMVELGLAPGLAAVATPVTDALTVKIAAKFESVGITIDNGCIVTAEAGRASVKAELRYSSNKLVGGGSDWIALPGKFQLDPPLLVSRSA
jgi:hypothetical protein